MLPPFKLDLCRYDEGYTLKRMEMERVMALQGGTFYPSLFFFSCVFCFTRIPRLRLVLKAAATFAP